MTTGQDTLARRPVRVKGPRTPEPWHMRLLGMARQMQDQITLRHAKGTPRGVDLDVAWEAVEAGWLEAPAQPLLEGGTRIWSFKLTERGKKAYSEELRNYA